MTECFRHFSIHIYCLEVATLDKSLLVGLVLSAVSGLAFIAYKHPNAYSRMYLPLLAVFGVFLAAALAWNAGILFAIVKLLAFVPEAQSEVAKATAEELSIPAFLLIIAPLLISALLVFLLFVPRLIAEDKKQDPPEEMRK